MTSEVWSSESRLIKTTRSLKSDRTCFKEPFVNVIWWTMWCLNKSTEVHVTLSLTGKNKHREMICCHFFMYIVEWVLSVTVDDLTWLKRHFFIRSCLIYYQQKTIYRTEPELSLRSMCSIPRVREALTGFSQRQEEDFTSSRVDLTFYEDETQTDTWRNQLILTESKIKLDKKG